MFILDLLIMSVDLSLTGLPFLYILFFFFLFLSSGLHFVYIFSFYGFSIHSYIVIFFSFFFFFLYSGLHFVYIFFVLLLLYSFVFCPIFFLLFLIIVLWSSFVYILFTLLLLYSFVYSHWRYSVEKKSIQINIKLIKNRPSLLPLSQPVIIRIATEDYHTINTL